MADTDPMDCPADVRCQRNLDEIPAMKRMIADMHVALVGDMRTGAPGLLAEHRDHDRRLGDLEARTNRHSDKIHVLQTETIPGLVAAGGTTAKKAWWEVGKAAITGAVGAALAWLAIKPPHP